jgi:hypothetical protein
MKMKNNWNNELKNKENLVLTAGSSKRDKLFLTISGAY